MATNTITFTLDNFCDAQAHGDLAALIDGEQAFKQVIHWAEEKELPTNEQLKTALRTFLREIIRRSGANTKAQVAATIPQLSITLDYPVM